jgi:ORF6N domain
MVLIPNERIEQAILVIRGQKVMLDADLAELYGVTTKRLNEQVKRNRDRFPKDFMFQIEEKEIVGMRSQIVTTSDSDENIRSQTATASKRNIRYLPYAFTEHGVIMAASILNTQRAIEVSVYVVHIEGCSGKRSPTIDIPLPECYRFYKNVIIGGAMVRTQIQLTEEQSVALKRMAAAEHISMAGIVRKAVDQVTRTGVLPEPEIRRRRAAAAAGRFHSGCGDLAEEHDRYLAEAYEK